MCSHCALWWQASVCFTCWLIVHCLSHLFRCRIDAVKLNHVCMVCWRHLTARNDFRLSVWSIVLCWCLPSTFPLAADFVTLYLNEDGTGDVALTLLEEGFLITENRRERRLQKLMAEYTAAQNAAKKNRVSRLQSQGYRLESTAFIKVNREPRKARQFSPIYRRILSST